MLTFPSIVKVTVTGLRISAVDTTAFLDNCADLIPYAGSGRRIRIKDAAGKYLDGVIGARGSGETLSATELVTNGGFDSDTAGWTPRNSASLSSVAGGESGNCLLLARNGLDYPKASQSASSTLNALYKLTAYAKEKELNICAIRIGTFVDGVTLGNILSGTLSGWTALSTYFNSTVTTIYYGLTSNALNGTDGVYFDTVSIKQVLAPSTSGLLIRNLAGAQSFQSQESGFTHNAASYAVEVFDMMRVV